MKKKTYIIISIVVFFIGLWIVQRLIFTRDDLTRRAYHHMVQASSVSNIDELNEKLYPAKIHRIVLSDSQWLAYICYRNDRIIHRLLYPGGIIVLRTNDGLLRSYQHDHMEELIGEGYFFIYYRTMAKQYQMKSSHDLLEKMHQELLSMGFMEVDISS